MQNTVAGSTDPSVDDIAAAAEVSRRTIYLHFPTLDQLLLDATAGLLASSGVEAAIDGAAGGAGDAAQRVDALVRALLAVSEEGLPLGRRIIGLTVGTPGVRRGYRRVEWITRALEPLRPRLTPEQFERLTSALALVVGWEAMTVLRDVRGLDPEAEEATLRWAARSLVAQMLAEVAD